MFKKYSTVKSIIVKKETTITCKVTTYPLVNSDLLHSCLDLTNLNHAPLLF